MALTKFRKLIQDSAGNLVTGVIATITVTGTGAAAALYSDAAGASPIVGNAVADTEGVISVFMRSGAYNITITRGGVVIATYTAEPVCYLGDDAILVGGGGGVTNDTASLQAFVTAGAGKVVDLPRGTYLITDAVVMPANTHLRGDGRGTIIKSLTLANGGTGIGHRQLELANGCKVSGVTFDAGSMTGFTSGMRSILAMGKTGLEVSDCVFITPGAATAFIGCDNYRICDNTISIVSTTGAAVHDGVIDQWAGSNDFSISNNTIHGNGIAAWPILVTGEDTAGDAAACYDFTISENQVRDCIQVGIWAMGRGGTVYDFTISDNVVKGVSLYYGIAATDCTGFTITGNVVKDTAQCGIRMFSETGQGGTIAARNGALANNVVVDANTSAITGVDPGSAISVTDNSERISITGNVVVGSTHRYAVHLGTNTTRCDISGANYATGVVGRFLNQNTGDTNTVPGASYTPTLTGVTNVASSTAGVVRFDRRGDTVFFAGRVLVTPTAGSDADTELGISLPVASNFAFTSNADGVASSGFGLVGAISADVSNDRLTLRFPAPNTSSNSISFSGAYTVLV